MPCRCCNQSKLQLCQQSLPAATVSACWPCCNKHAPPADRWGNAKSPAYGTLSDYQFMRKHSGSQKGLEKARAAWGSALSSVDDVIKVFVKYCSGASAVHSSVIYLSCTMLACYDWSLLLDNCIYLQMLPDAAKLLCSRVRMMLASYMSSWSNLGLPLNAFPAASLPSCCLLHINQEQAGFSGHLAITVLPISHAKPAVSGMAVCAASPP